MKKIILYAIVAAVVVTGSSCSDLLDKNSYKAIPPEAVTEDDIPALRMGIYSSFQVGDGPQARSYIMFDILGGSIRGNTGTPKDQINGMLSPLNAYVVAAWRGYFFTLYQVNNLISIAEQFPNSDEAKIALGESYYFRAYIYYNFVTRWGGVPILKQNTRDQVARDPAEKVWDFIESELTAAMDILGDSKSYYYVSYDAAAALMARVKLSRGKMAEAATLAESLIGKYKLDSFEKIFRKTLNTEIIFAFENLSDESSINISDFFYTYAHPNKGQGIMKPTQEIIDLFDDSDKRKDISFVNISGQTLINKYPSGQTGRDPVIVSRVAEMYLISAEAKGRTDGLERLNELRRFRGLADVSPVPSNDTEFMDAVMLERRRELMAENFQYYDLIRTGRAVDELNLLPHQVLLPIPGKELLLNPLLEPNPGY